MLRQRRPTSILKGGNIVRLEVCKKRSSKQLSITSIEKLVFSYDFIRFQFEIGVESNFSFTISLECYVRNNIPIKVYTFRKAGRSSLGRNFAIARGEYIGYMVITC